MRCGICHAPLRVRGYRMVAAGNATGGKRRAPLYHPCSRLSDPAAHPARFKGKPHPPGCLCDDCTVATGREHAEADAACGREWTCQCGACRRAREINIRRAFAKLEDTEHALARVRAFKSGHSAGHSPPVPPASDPADAHSSSCAKGDSNPHGVTH